MSRLPQAVAESARVADAIEQQLMNPQDPAAAAPTTDPAPAPAPEPAPAPSPAADPLPAVDPAEFRKLQQQYRTLQGQYNRLVAKEQSSSETIQQLQNKLAAASAGLNPAPGTDEGSSLSTLRDFLGADPAAAIDQRIEAVVRRILGQSLTPLTDVMSTQLANDEQRAIDAYYDRLDALCPDWEQINADPGFGPWLEQVDPASGQTLLALMKDAEAKLDARRTAVFIETYKRELAKATGQRQPSPVPQTQPAPTPTAPHVKYLRRADIEVFYQDVQRGRYRGREADVMAMEREIATAQREGRIVD